ncbi:MAG: acyl-CoA dehydrogenase family protein [Jiangellales bacterium]
MQLTQEHDDFRRVVAEVVEKEINPFVDEWERAGTFPAHELFPKLGQVGIFGIEYDPEYGGLGLDHSYTLVMAEALGQVSCAGIPMAIMVQAAMATPALAKHGSHELKETYLAPVIAGEQVCSVAVSEPDAGSDVAGIRTKAVRDGDEWVINGSKLYITNGTQADWICLLARTEEGSTGFAGMSMIIVPTDTPGFSVSRKLDKLGNWSSDTAELSFDDVRVPLANTVGEPGRGFQMQMEQFQIERLVGSYSATAGAEIALRRTIEYLQVRQAFGKPLLANQALKYRLAELLAEVDVLREYNHAAAARIVAGEDATRMATISKLKAGRLTREVADTCLQYHGGMGYMEETWTSRYFRDARLLSIGGGADEVMLRILTVLEGMGK